MRLLICGDRNWRDEGLIRGAVSQIQFHRKIDVVIHGAARGADTLAGEVAESLGIPIEIYEAKWKDHGKRAGIIRNQQMLDEGKPDLVLACHDDLANSKGTAHMVRIARQSQIHIVFITHKGVTTE